MKLAHEKHLEQTHIQGLAEWCMYHHDFMQNIYTYMQLLMTTEFKNQYSYKSKTGRIHLFPFTGYIGTMGIMNTYMESFNTCCRYACLERAKKERPLAEKIYAEVIERLEQSQKVWSSLKPNQLEVAQKAQDQLYETMHILQCGFFLIDEMIHFMNKDEEAFDHVHENKFAAKWREVSADFKEAKNWGF